MSASNLHDIHSIFPLCGKILSKLFTIPRTPPPGEMTPPPHPAPAFHSLSSESFFLIAHEVKTPPYSCRDAKHHGRYKAALWFFQRIRCAVSWGGGPWLIYIPGHLNGPCFPGVRAPVFRQSIESGSKDGTPDAQTGGTF